MSELVFNELSVHPLASSKTESYKRVEVFLETFKKAEMFNFNRVRFKEGWGGIQLSGDYTLGDFCKDNRTKGMLLRGLARHPYIDDDSEEEERYIENSFSMDQGGKELKPYRLAAAYLYSTVGIGYLSGAFWDKLEYELEIKGKEERTVAILCLSKPDHCEEKVFKDWIYDNTEVELLESELAAEEKSVALGDDHGIDILRKFAKKIVKSPYVTGVINSLPFNPWKRNFIRKVYPTGNIEIVFTDTDAGLGMAVKTTGRNLKETRAIAQILKEKYG